MAYAQELSKLIKDKFGAQLNVSAPIGGNADLVAFVVPYASPAEVETTGTKLMADADYQKLAAANAQTFLPGSTHDEPWLGG